MTTDLILSILPFGEFEKKFKKILLITNHIYIKLSKLKKLPWTKQNKITKHIIIIEIQAYCLIN